MTKTVLIKTMLESYSWPQFSNKQADSMVWLAQNYGAEKVLQEWKKFQKIRPGYSPGNFRDWFLSNLHEPIKFS